MAVYENDVLDIPETIKNMSVSEIKAAKEQALKELLASKQPRKVTRPNKNNIVFKY